MVTTATQHDNVRLVRQFFEAYARHDHDRIVAALDPEVEAHPSIHGGPRLHGRDEVARWYREHAYVDGDLEARPLDYEQRGDFVLVRGYLRHRDGRTLAESQLFWLYQLRGGLIVRMESYPTRASALAAA